MIQSFKDLIVWQKAYELVLRVYRLTEKFPKSEQYGLLSQIRRSSVSIVSNIARVINDNIAVNIFNFCLLASVLVRNWRPN